MTNEQETNILRLANKIGGALEKKFPKHDLFVRHYTNGDSGYVEIAMRPKATKSSAAETTMAYSDEFFLSINKDNINDKARRIYGDFKTYLGG